jgi:hypothetical protein
MNNTVRIAYEIVAVEAEKLFNKVVSARNQEEVFQKYKDYTDYLEACGWSVAEYDQEQLKRIDTDWEPPQN